ncbi:MAG: DUF4433 domain-containing protein [Candidatus Riflebacteria bacterium]|nr:DUF4433 domain-containing protein [Candidatus Riflebacteria bacterium]
MHITHERNLPAILRLGLLCKKEADRRNIAYISIADEGIQSRRSQTVVPVGAGGTIHDYVPLFFGARPPMLYAVNRRVVRQSEIAYILVRWDVLTLRGTVFTDGNASTNGTRFFDSREQLREVDQKACGAMWWNKPPDIRRKKSAEVLVYSGVGVEHFGGLVVMDNEAKDRVLRVVQARGLQLNVYVGPGWYYL